MPAIVERLRLWGINHLYVIGGNGGNAAAHAIAKECAEQGVLCNVVGVPKSIDNDIQLVSMGLLGQRRGIGGIWPCLGC
jgi:6-phosphofructokinase 1